MDRQARREQIRGWLEVRRREGLTVRELSERSGISQKTLYRWSSRFRREAGSEAGGPELGSFVELVESPPTDVPIEVVLQGGRRLILSPGFDEEALVLVVRTLERC